MKYQHTFSVLLGLLFCNTELIGQSLDDYIHQALEANPGIHASKASLLVAQQQADRVSGLPDPVLSGGVYVLPVETRVGPQTFKASYVQRFPWFGTIAARKDAAILAAESAAFGVESIEDQLIYAVQASWYNLYGLERKLDLTRTDLEILHGLEALVTKRYESGKASLVDVIRVQWHIDASETALENLEQRRLPLQAAFNALLDRPAEALIVIPDSLPIPLVSLPANTLKNPQLSALDRKAEAFGAAAEIARKDGLPTFGLGLEYAHVQQRTDMELPNNGQDIVAPIVSIALPIYRRRHEAAVSQAGWHQASVESQRADLALRLSAEYELVKWEALAEKNRIALYDRQVVAAEGALDVLLTAFTTEKERFESVLELQQEILQFKLARVDALVGAYHANARLNYLSSSR